MKRKLTILNMSLISIGIALNVIGALLASLFRIPIYLDSIGTILVAFLLGPRYAIFTGVLGSLVSGMTFDYFSFYYAPVQIVTALTSSLVAKKGAPWWGIALVGLPTALASACVTAAVFGGFTSSASTYIVILLNKSGLSMTLSVFLAQLFSDCLDKSLAAWISRQVSHTLRGRMLIYAKI